MRVISLSEAQLVFRALAVPVTFMVAKLGDMQNGDHAGHKMTN